MPTCINLFEKFGVCTVLLPYYGTVDRSFLLLSQLNWRSRVMIDDYFEEILNWLIWNITLLKIDEEWQEKFLLLPSNLFKFEIILNWEELVNTFLSKIQSINDKKGYYFNEHFMHSRLYIELLRVKDNFVLKLFPHIDLLKTTEIIDCID